MTKRILGIDTGTNSLGWAIVDKNESSRTYSLVDDGCLIFTEGVKTDGSSKAAERTKFRSLRKQYFRRRLRKIEVLKALVEYRLCPPLLSEDLNLWHTRKVYPKSEAFLLWQRTDDNAGKNPYSDRHRCLHERLNLDYTEDRYTLGRAFYHLAQRRGFLSNRLDSSAEDAENGIVKTRISQLSEEMKSAHCDYLGDYFHQLYAQHGNAVKIRKRYTDREAHLRKEFDAICDCQQLDAQMVEALARAIFFQRPLKSQRAGVGKCTFEPTKSRCADSHPDYEEFRLLSQINAIKIKTPYDIELRPLTSEEKAKITPLFYRKSKSNFDFEDIAKALAGKNNYGWVRDKADKFYKFNFRMTQGFSGCPTTAQLIAVFGKDWQAAIGETFLLSQKKDGTGKTLREMADDVWKVLYSFSSAEKLQLFGREKLQLGEQEAEAFSKIRLTRGFATLSLNALRKMLPFLREGMLYSHAVFFANIPAIVGKRIWENDAHRRAIRESVEDIIFHYNGKDRAIEGTIDFCIKEYLKNNFELSPGAVDKLYHPSMIETYPDARADENGVYQLGSPKTNAVRNPMAMRSLHCLRKVINQLLRKRLIDSDTEVHIEYARELNDANKRKAIADYQKGLEKKRKEYEKEIQKLYKKATGRDIVPTETDLLKFELWEEQQHVCLYTGDHIGIADFLGENPRYDIEHTIPQSVGGDSTKMNLTLCSSHFNRDVKKARIPSELPNHAEILARIQEWKTNYEKSQRELDRIRTHSGMAKEKKDSLIQNRHYIRLHLSYWKGKYERFVMTEVPEGFSRRQGAGIGLISKYAGLYLKSLFHDKDDRNKSNVYVVKGVMTAEFRRMWGLQDAYEKKSRDNHSHHTIDAITIACIGKDEYEEMTRFYRMEEAYRRAEGNKPSFRKPWDTFTEDVLNIDQRLLVVHTSPDNLLKKAHKYVQTVRGKFLAQGDSARLSLHKDTYYGAIKKPDTGELKYVRRKPVTDFKSPNDVKNIVDPVVHQKIMEAFREHPEEAKQGIFYMNREKGILIKRVRVSARPADPLKIRAHRDLSRKEYKRQFNVVNDENYLIAIYEGKEKGKAIRDFKIVNNLEAVTFHKKSHQIHNQDTLIEAVCPKDYPLKTVLKRHQMVLLFEKSPKEIRFNDKQDLAKRLYEVIGIAKEKKEKRDGSFKLIGRVKLKHHQESRKENLQTCNTPFKNDGNYFPIYRNYINQLNLLVEGVDFFINAVGDITPHKG